MHQSSRCTQGGSFAGRWSPARRTFVGALIFLRARATGNREPLLFLDNDTFLPSFSTTCPSSSVHSPCCTLRGRDAGGGGEEKRRAIVSSNPDFRVKFESVERPGPPWNVFYAPVGSIEKGNESQRRGRTLRDPSPFEYSMDLVNIFPLFYSASIL